MAKNIFYSETYSGSAPYTTTFTPTSKTDLCDQIKTALVAAGWSATGGSGDWYLSTPNTHPDGLLMKIRIWTNTNCVQFALYDPTGSVWNLSANPCAWLLYSLGVCRVNAGAYWCWINFDTGVATARGWAFFGLPKIADYLAASSPSAITDAQFVCGNSRGDASTTVSNNMLTDARCSYAQRVYNSTRSYSTSDIVFAPAVREVNSPVWWADWSVNVGPATCGLNDGVSRNLWVGYYFDMIAVDGLDFVIGDQFSFDSKTWRVVGRFATYAGRVLAVVVP